MESNDDDEIATDGKRNEVDTNNDDENATDGTRNEMARNDSDEVEVRICCLYIKGNYILLRILEAQMM